MCIPIQRVHRSAENVTHVGGSTSEGVPWGLRIDEAWMLIASKQYGFFVEIPAGKRVDVLAKRSSAGSLFLTTSPDGVAANNLDMLPDMPFPLAGVVPPFPLNIPGASLGQLAAVTSLAYAVEHQLQQLGSPPYGYVESIDPVAVIEMPAGDWLMKKPRWFYVNAVLPFPAEYRVQCNGVNLERVPGDSPARRRDLEAAGKGWWSFEFVLTKPDGSLDPTKPSRMTEVRCVLRPAEQDWNSAKVYFGISALSINTYCLGGAPNGAVVLKIARDQPFAVASPPRPPAPEPATVTMPSLVGKALDVATTILFALGLTKIFITNPTGVLTTKDLVVTSQGPAAGTPRVKVTDQVGLVVALGAGQRGVKTVTVTNQSNPGKALELWTFDYTTGLWASKGQVAYQGSPVVVAIANGHTYMLAGVDATRASCRSGRPDELACVYASTSETFVGDDKGVAASWQIV